MNGFRCFESKRILRCENIYTDRREKMPAAGVPLDARSVSERSTVFRLK